MKKLTLLIAALSSLLTPSIILAAAGDINIEPPGKAQGKSYGYSDIGKFVSNVLTLAFAIALLVVLFMLIWGAFEWITSGGDKDSVGKARNRIVNALIGLAVLAVAFAIATVAGQFLGFKLTEIPIPTPPPP